MLQNVDKRENVNWRKAVGKAVWFACAMGCSAAISPVGAAGQAAGGAAAGGAPAAPVTIALEEAIRRAEASDGVYAAASANSRSAVLDRAIARAGMLPNAHVLNQDIYTQPNGIYNEGDAGQSSAPLPRFVANDSRPDEYYAQGIVDEALSLAGPAAVRRADAASAQAAAELEIARRGLVAGSDGDVLQLAGGGSARWRWPAGARQEASTSPG